ncbi:MAG: FMN-binding glutamate synthase family protein [Bdellovibrionota bacterium]
MRKLFIWSSVSLTAVLVLVGIFVSPGIFWSFAFVGPLLVMGYIDYFQNAHALRRNFPVIGRMRYWAESLRPKVNQYFVESNTDGVPFSREQRSVVYQRAKGDVDSVPFGTQHDVYADGYEWVTHSLSPSTLKVADLRTTIGGPQCSAPYSASIFNISAMSYGSLSQNAILALNGAALDGKFAHNTGEGGLSQYHLQHGGDLIWQIGTGYFSCRNEDGSFSAALFEKNAMTPQIKMIELKLSQGAKPSHGGILPAKKVTREISEIRNVPMGKDVVSPPAHSEFSTPVGMLEFVARLRKLSGGKPVGIKLCLGKRREFMALCKAMKKTGIRPDYISIDGGEGGTGAAPLEFSNYVGYPGVDALVFVHHCLLGFGLRSDVKLFTSGKVTTSFEILKRLALGADVVYSARGMLLALGCIQALQCNTNRCPTGVATQDPGLVAGLVVPDKRKRVANFHHETLSSLAHMLSAMGIKRASYLRPWHVMKRVNGSEVKHYGELYPYVQMDDFLKGKVPSGYQRCFDAADPDSFEPLFNDDGPAEDKAA